jgi:hypothetical protein
MVLLSDRQSIWEWADETAKRLDVPFQAVVKRLIRAVVDGELKAEFDPFLGSPDDWRGQLKATLLMGLNFDIRINDATGFFLRFVMVHRSDFNEWFCQHNKTPSVTIAGARRGPKAGKRLRVQIRMRSEIDDGTLTTIQLEKLPEKQLAQRYGVSRDTARKARNAVLDDLKK